jgi:hypothetical protein
VGPLFGTAWAGAYAFGLMACARIASNTSLGSSNLGRSVQTVYVEVPSFRIKTFLNKIFESQAGEIF